MKIQTGEAEQAMSNAAQWNAAWLTTFGPDHATRAATIASVFERRDSTAFATHCWLFDGLGGNFNLLQQQGYCTFTASRSLASSFLNATLLRFSSTFCSTHSRK